MTILQAREHAVGEELGDILCAMSDNDHNLIKVDGSDCFEHPLEKRKPC